MGQRSEPRPMGHGTTEWALAGQKAQVKRQGVPSPPHLPSQRGLRALAEGQLQPQLTQPRLLTSGGPGCHYCLQTEGGWPQEAGWQPPCAPLSHSVDLGPSYCQGFQKQDSTI